VTERYEDLITDARDWVASVDPPTPSPSGMLDRLDARARELTRRRWLAGLLALLVVAAWVVSIVAHPLGGLTCEWASPPDIVRYGVVHVVAFVFGAAMVSSQRTWAQILVRAFWWSSLLAASVASWTEFGTLPLLMPVLLVASAAGLWMLGDDTFGVDIPDGDLALVRHRAAVVAMMVFAVADTETLLGAALNHDEPEALHFAFIDLGCAVAMVAAMVGLYRLRTWGFLAVLGLNIIIAGLALGGLLVYDRGFALVFAATAAIQIVLGTPLALTLLGRTRERASRWAWPPWARHVALAVVLAAGGIATVRGMQPDTLAAHCADT